MNIVVVEDEGITSLFLSETLKELGHNVLAIVDNANSLFEFEQKNKNIDLIFMDIQIKGSIDGIKAAQKIYAVNKKIEYVFVTSYKDSETIKEAQSVEPIGYLIKPVIESDIEAIMMIAEVKTSKYIPESQNEKNIIIDTFTYNIDSRILFNSNQIVELTHKELTCIDYLFKNKNNYVSIEQLINVVWDGEEKGVNSLRELMFRLRKKVPSLNIKNTPKIGYILTDKKI